MRRYRFIYTSIFNIYPSAYLEKIKALAYRKTPTVPSFTPSHGHGTWHSRQSASGSLGQTGAGTSQTTTAAVVRQRQAHVSKALAQQLFTDPTAGLSPPVATATPELATNSSTSNPVVSAQEPSISDDNGANDDSIGRRHKRDGTFAENPGRGKAKTEIQKAKDQISSKVTKHKTVIVDHMVKIQELRCK